MQEMPDPITKLSWDNAALFSPKTARELDLKHGDVVKIDIDGRSVEAPVFIQPGTADYSITLPLGYGRTKVGPVGEGAGFNAYSLRTSSTLGFAVGAKVTKTGKTYKLATTQEHWSVAEHHLLDEQLHERGIVREGTLDEFHEHPQFAREMGVNAPQGADNIATNPLEQYKEAAKDPASTIHQWGMVVDMNACVGCNACAVACQAENNVPIVGKDMVLEGREMHWLRIDRYFTGEDPEGDVEAVAQPMMCQQCENAPCEPVCPVNATTHTEEGLNAMTYNRCIGTRYCANNCPYKVRRFNFFDYNKGTFYEKSKAMRTGSTSPDPIEGWSKPQSFQPDLQELSKMQKNPQVTVRMRGVMEKCTFCVQRIENARIDHNAAAGQENPGKIRDGAFQSACEQACPTKAIIFGDISQPTSRVSVAKQSPRNYEALGHLNTRPRTTYLARVRNVNPAWPKEKHARISLPVLGRCGHEKFNSVETADRRR
jgi:molybdopterin-containing oxidoreductase family iron-sulfur binding subunit